MTLGKKIKELRIKANLSLRELGRIAKLDFTYLSKIENDKTDDRKPSEDLIKRLAKALKTDEIELLSLANRIPEETEKKITSKSRNLKFFRDFGNKLNKLDDKDWKEIEKLIQDISEGRK